MRAFFLAVVVVLAVGCSGSAVNPGTGGGNGGSGGSGGSGVGGGAGGGEGGGEGGGSAAGGGAGGGTAGGTGGGTMELPPDAGVVVTANLDSAILRFPRVNGAADYRAYPKGATVEMTTRMLPDGGMESGMEVKDSIVYCAGLRQRNAKATTPEPMLAIEVHDITAPTEFVVEAIDKLCPFPGMFGKVHGEIPLLNKANDVSNSLKGNYPVRTEAEIRAIYNGSMIVNGQGPGPKVGMPAPPNSPKVLKQFAPVMVEPSSKPPPVTKFFDGFGDSNDQPVFIKEYDSKAPQGDRARHYSNSKWNFQMSNMEAGPGSTQIFVDRGQLHLLLADLEQDVFAQIVAYPKMPPVKFSSDKYVHITWESHTLSSQRRYWWLSVCGAATVGKTLDDAGFPQSEIVQTPFFYDPDGQNPAYLGWNCFQMFPRGGSSFPLAPNNKPPESDVRVMVNKPQNDRKSVVNLSPNMLNGLESPSWFRTLRAGKPAGVMLDDKLQVAPKVRFDVYLKKDRLVLYVDGEQRLCNDFVKYPLTMAEGLIGFGQVLYHSTAEYTEFSLSFWNRTGQRHILQNNPWADQRAWDNMGFDEDVAAPTGFDASACFVAP